MTHWNDAMIRAFSGRTAAIASGVALLAVIWFKGNRRPATAGVAAPKATTREAGTRGAAPLLNTAIGYALQRISLMLLRGLSQRALGSRRVGSSRSQDWMDGIATAALVNLLDGKGALGRLRTGPAESLSSGARTALYAAFGVGLALAKHMRRRMRSSTTGSVPGGGQLAFNGERNPPGISRV